MEQVRYILTENMTELTAIAILFMLILQIVTLQKIRRLRKQFERVQKSRTKEVLSDMPGKDDEEPIENAQQQPVVAEMESTKEEEPSLRPEELINEVLSEVFS